MKTIQLNSDVLEMLYGGCEESKSEVFSEFLSGYSDLRQNLFSAYESGSLDSMKGLLHHHGPCFMYLGVPEVADCFKKLELRCKTVQDRDYISVDFFNLLKMVQETWLQVYHETKHYGRQVDAA